MIPIQDYLVYLDVIVYPKNAAPDDHEKARLEWWPQEGPMILGDISEVTHPFITAVRHFPAGGTQLAPSKMGNGYGVCVAVTTQARDEREAWSHVSDYAFLLANALGGNPYDDSESGYRASCRMGFSIASIEGADYHAEEYEDEYGENLLEPA